MVYRWRKNAFDKLAYVSRYGHVPPSESARWDFEDLRAFNDALSRIVDEESKSR